MDFLRCNSTPEFLQAALASGRRPLSIRGLSRKLGYASDRGLGMALKGQRPLSVEMQARLSRFLKLTPKEQLHLGALVRQQRHPEAVVESSRQKSSKPPRLLPQEDLHPLVPAYSLAILELVRLAKTPLTLAEIAARLRERVSLRELSQTLLQMAAVGLLKLEADGCVRALREDEYVTSSLDMPSTVIRRIHRQQLARAADTLEEQSVSEREFIAKTFSIPADRVEDAKRLLREKFEEIAAEIAGGSSLDDSTVVQLNLQFYLQSRR